MNEVNILIVSLLTFMLIICLIFLPTIVAYKNGKRNRFAIFLVNVLLGWTGIFWVVALVWSVMKD